MTETEAPPPAKPTRFHFAWLLPALFRPGATLAQVMSAPGDTWLTPMLALTLASLARIAAAGWTRQANPGPVNLPQAFQYWSPDQQAQFTQAQGAAQGPAFLYIFPGIFALLEVWLGWLILTSLLHLVLTLLGSRGGTRAALNLVAWASLPLAGRDLVRAAAIFSTHQLVTQPGLSGFAPADGSAWAVYLGELLKLIDIYVLWHALLLVSGLRSAGLMSARKAWLGVGLTLLGVRLLQAVPGFALARFGELNVALPFFGY